MIIDHHGRMARLARTATLLSAIACLGLAGCASNTKRPALDPAKVSRFNAQGYPAPHEFGTQESEDLRLVNGVPARLVWTRPADMARHPLLIYMPGLGQDAHALAHARQAWAAAGYVVLSWQPLPDDEPQAAHHDDPQSWARGRHAPALLQRRAELLAQLYNALLTAQAAHDARLADVDLAHIGLIGYELGAFTTMYAAGEAVAGAARPASLPLFQAYIAISPYANFEMGAFDTRYRDVSPPVLTITSDSDVDLFGLVPAAYLRAAPYGGMPAGDKFMLLLHGARHGALGEREDQPDSPRGSAHDDSQPSLSTNGGKSGKGHAKGMRNGTDDQANAMSGSASGANGGSPTSMAMQQIAQINVSTAFLDAQLNHDKLAQQWLRTQAGKWLAPVGDWNFK